MSKQKPLIVFEGIEGSGKTTLINFVSEYLKKNRIKYIKIREPGGNKNSELIRRLILNKKNKFNTFTDLMLYLAARSENVEKIIEKYYKKKNNSIRPFYRLNYCISTLWNGFKQTVNKQNK